MARLRGAELYPQLSDEYTLRVPLVQPARKFNVILADAVVNVLNVHCLIILCKDKKATTFEWCFLSILSIL